MAVGPPRSERNPRKPRRAVAQLLDLPQDGGLGTALDDAALVLGDGAEGAAAEAAAHDGDRETDHLPGRDARPTVAVVGPAAVGEFVHPVQLGAGQGDGRRVEPEVAVAVALRQGAGIARIGLQMKDPGGMGVEQGIVPHLLIGGQAHERMGASGLTGPLAKVRDRYGHRQRPPFAQGGARRGPASRHPWLRCPAARIQVVGIAMRVPLGPCSGVIKGAGVDLDPVRGQAPGHKGGAAQIPDGRDGLAGG